MKAITFPGCNVILAKDQPEYNQLPAMVIEENGQYVICWEVSTEDLIELNRTRKLYYSQLTFGHPFQPIQLSVDLEDMVNMLSLEVAKKAMEYTVEFHKLMVKFAEPNFMVLVEDFKHEIINYYRDLTYEGKDTFKKKLPDALKALLS